jgi:hypothetical protein
MIGGCLKNMFAMAGCAVILLIAAVAGWQYRTQLSDAFRAFRGEGPVAEEEAFQEGPGSPSPEARRSAVATYQRMARIDGPEFVVLSAAEMASLIQDGLDPIGRRALDSLTVTFEDGRFIMEARLVTEVWGKDALGLLGGLLQPREPLRVAGPAHIVRRGVLAWEPNEFSVRSIPFPRAAIPAIVNRLTGGDTGQMLFGVPSTIAEIRIEPNKMTFFRRVQ